MNFPFLKIVSIVLSIIFISNCAPTKEEANNTELEHYETTQSYEYASYESGKECTTDKHSFTGSSQWEKLMKLCESLLDDQINNYCAKKKRMEKYISECKSHDGYSEIVKDYYAYESY